MGWPRGILCVLGLALSCSAPAKQSAKPPAPPPDRDSTHAILDVDDKCGVLPTCGFQDEDGCPDVMVSFALGKTALDSAASKLVGEVATELSVRDEISVVEVIGTTTLGEPSALAKNRADAVAAQLVSLGVRTARIRTRADGAPGTAQPHVYFDVRCGGAADRDEDGIVDHLDKCPDAPEDLDGYQDEDGCPETDPPSTCTMPDGSRCMSE